MPQAPRRLQGMQLPRPDVQADKYDRVVLNAFILLPPSQANG
jgi:hypothetical protein